MAASTFTMIDGPNVFAYNIRGVFSSADETDTAVIDISTKVGPTGGPPSKIKIDEIWWTVNGFNYVLLEFDRGTDVVIDYFMGQGYMDFRPYGGKTDNGSGGTGDLLLTTSGGAAGGSYSFLIKGRFKA